MIMGKFTTWLGGAMAPRKVMRVPMPPGAIRPDESSLLQQRGWRRSGKHYAGPFATPFGTWHGRIEAAGDVFRCYIKDPPIDVVARHHKWACFSRDSTQGWWRINLAVSPIDHDVSAVLLYVERLLIESHRLAGRT